MTRGVTTVTRQTTMRQLEALFDNRMPIRPLKFRGAVRDALRLFAALYPEVPNGEGSSGGAFDARRLCIRPRISSISRTLEGRAATIKARWICEQAHQQLKEELGLDHFEGRSWQGLHRHALMTMLAFAFLQHRRLKTARRGKKSMDRRLNQACRPSATPSSRSSLNRHRNDARTVENGLVSRSGVSKSAKVVPVWTWLIRIQLALRDSNPVVRNPRAVCHEFSRTPRNPPPQSGGGFS